MTTTDQTVIADGEDITPEAPEAVQDVTIDDLDIEVTPDASDPADDGDVTAEDAHEDAQNPGREAAKYRRQLREARVELDATKALLTEARRGLVEQAARSALRVPAGLWASGVTPDDMFTPDGALDVDKVDAAVRDGVARLGLSSGFGWVSPDAGVRTAPTAAPRFADVLKG